MPMKINSIQFNRNKSIHSCAVHISNVLTASTSAIKKTEIIVAENMNNGIVFVRSRILFSTAFQQ